LIALRQFDRLLEQLLVHKGHPCWAKTHMRCDSDEFTKPTDITENMLTRTRIKFKGKKEQLTNITCSQFRIRDKVLSFRYTP
jgi:hypothetical protein